MEAFCTPHLYVHSTCLGICCVTVYDLKPIFEINNIHYVSLLHYLSHSQTYSKTFSLYLLASNTKINRFKAADQLVSKIEFNGDIG